MSISILTLVDDDITVNEKIEDNVYEYLINMISMYKNNELKIYLVLTDDSKVTYIKLYET